MAQQTTNQKQEEYSIQTADPVWLREEADRVIRFFAERLREVEIVEEVRFTYEVHGVTGWVITKGPRMEFPSERPVHEAIGDVLGFQKVPLFDFRIVNLNELPEGNSMDYYIPKQAETLWKREDG